MVLICINIEKYTSTRVKPNSSVFLKRVFTYIIIISEILWSFFIIIKNIYAACMATERNIIH